MDGSEGKAVLVVHHVAAELGPGRLQLEVGAKEVGLLFQNFDVRGGLVVEPRTVVTAGNHCIADFLDGSASALTGNARVSVAIENDRRPQLWSNHAVEIDHARLARSIVAGVVAAGVLPAIRRTWPGGRRGALHMQSRFHIRPHHPLRRVVVQGAWQRPVQGRGVRKEVQLIDVGLLPALGKTPRCGGQELSVQQLALLVRCQGQAGRDLGFPAPC
mmetsp:Transcript_33908/g.81307  ORF Transcript_33908/g.81307 Transcript_33908/m.81307 type:complete len:216 (+) Transcript_33908:278-925(+)